MGKNDKTDKERQRRAFFHEANEEYKITDRVYDSLPEEDKAAIIRKLRHIRHTAYLDRSKFKNWQRYMLSNPVYFEDIFRKECTISNVAYEFKMIKIRGYKDDTEEPAIFTRVNSEGCYWRSRKTTGIR